MRTRGRSRRLLLKTLAMDQAGAELFEFALVLPLLLALVLGIIWIGRAYNVYETITRAAREGVRYAVLPSAVGATPSNTYTDSYATAGSAGSACAGYTSPNTAIFTNYIAPALQASSLNSSAVTNYCEQAYVVDPDADSSVAQCGVQISFSYPVTLAIPFTSVNATTISISTHVEMRMEQQPITSSGAPACPGVY